MNGPPYTFGIPNTVLTGNFYFDVTRFDSAISSVGINIYWRQGHICPCGAITGSPDPQCLQCAGWGRYWDAPTAAFTGVISMMYPEDPGGKTDDQLGTVIESRPVLTIPQIAGEVWDSAVEYDQFVLPDMTQRFTINLTNGMNFALPYSYGVSIPATGACFYYDSQTKQISADNNYTVGTINGITYVTLTDQPSGQPFSVEYTANQAYIAYNRGSMPHVRPEVGGMHMPRRFQLEPADLWIRAHSTTS